MNRLDARASRGRRRAAGWDHSSAARRWPSCARQPHRRVRARTRRYDFAGRRATADAAFDFAKPSGSVTKESTRQRDIGCGHRTDDAHRRLPR